MARQSFGGDIAGYTIAAGSGGVATLVGGATLTFWSAQSGGSQHTDLRTGPSGSVVASVVVSSDGTDGNAVGQIPLFLGPDEVYLMWASANGGPRVLLVANSLASLVPAISASVTTLQGHAAAVNPHGIRLADLSGVNTASIESAAAGYVPTMNSSGTWIAAPGGGGVSSVAGKTGAVSLVAGDVGGVPVGMSQIIPAYIYPSFAGSDWDTFTANPDGFVIANPNTGPGTSSNSDYVTAIDKARAAGMKVLGYVSLEDVGGPGTRAQGLVTADVTTWHLFYNIDGIFFDVAPTGGNGDKTAYFKAVCDFAHAAKPGQTVVVNPGTHPLTDAYVEPADIVCTWEGSYTANSYATATVPSYAAGWYGKYPPTKYLHLVYGVTTEATMRLALAHAQSMGVRWFFAQDNALWQDLPSYYNEQVTALRSTSADVDVLDRRTQLGTVRAADVTGLGAAGLLALGKSSGTVAAGNDSRITEAARAAKLDKSTSHRGVNLAGAEFGIVGQTYGVNWRWPGAQEFNFIASRGFDLVRLPFMWERQQPVLGSPMDATQQAKLVETVGYARAAGLKVVLDLHNYTAYNGQLFGATPGPTLAQFIDIWLRLSTLFRDDETVVGYGLMNEPRNMPLVGAETGRDRWQTWSQACLDAIRATGDATCILVGGYSSSSLGGWLNTTAGHPNPWIIDPLDNYAYEAHHYWDSNGGAYSTTYAQELTATAAFGSGDTVQKKFLGELKGWLNWLRTHNVRGYVGEVGWPRVVGVTTTSDSNQWNAMGEQWYRLLDAAGPLVWGCTFWAAGSFWSSTYSLRPYGNDGSGNLATLLENAATLEAHKPFRGEIEIQPKKAFTPIDYGQRWRGQTYDQLLVTTQALLTGNQVYATMVDILDASRIDQVVVHVQAVAVSPTAGQCFVALYDQQTGAQVAISADIGSLLTSTGNRAMDLTAPTRIYEPGERLYVALLWNGTTAPTLGKTGTISAVLSATPRRWGYVTGAATAMPATISPGSLTATTAAFWVAVAGH